MPSQSRLVPFDVPWMVSPSVAGLNSCTWESDHTFVAFNVSLPNEVDPRGVPLDSTNPRVVMSFESGQYVKLAPCDGGIDALGSEFDTSALPHFDPSESERYSKLFNERWHREQRCPDPGVYEVEDSEWGRLLGANTLRHFLIVAPELRLDVIAKRGIWEYLRSKDPYYNDADWSPFE